MLNLEVGKSYLNENGDKIKIIDYDSEYDFFIDYRCYVYTKNGQCPGMKPKGFYLVSEVNK